ncbi:hypothetical protein BC833DRAFT_579193 [Globomyces pollinis-pini]|nr:hypothetical protein BC833DRAFT_579193 [Globomyces pollinis-pini]
MLSLYRSIRKLHRNLPPELEVLGNAYLKSEFKRHKTADSKFLIQFKKEWESYHQTLLSQIHDESKIGKSLEKDKLNNLSNAQWGQLYELKKTTTMKP